MMLSTSGVSKRSKKSRHRKGKDKKAKPAEQADDFSDFDASINNGRKNRKKQRKTILPKDGIDTVPAGIDFCVGRCDAVSDRYEKMGRSRLGKGTYGIVYQAKDRRTGQYVALKRCIPHHKAREGFPITTLREIQSLRICSQHPNIVHFEDVAISRSGVFLVFEYCDHDLSKLLDTYYSKLKRSPFQEAQAKTLLIHLLEALDHVHTHHLIHRDIKLSNLLYSNQTGMLKLADFGLSRPVADSEEWLMTLPVASLWYRPIDLLLGVKTYDTSIDLWGVGCIMGEFLLGQPLMKGSDEREQVDQILDCLGVPQNKYNDVFWTWPLIQNEEVCPPHPDNNINKSSTYSHRFKMGGRRTILDSLGNRISQAGLKLILGLLEFDPRKRFSTSTALQSPYLQSEEPRPIPPEEMPKFPRTFQT